MEQLSRICHSASELQSCPNNRQETYIPHQPLLQVQTLMAKGTKGRNLLHIFRGCDFLA
jgi:hypothetical protein